MKRLFKIAAALVCAVSLTAFASTVTATLTDSDGTVWGNCTWSAVISSPAPPTIAGTPVPASQLRANGSCTSGGVITATMLDTSSVQQAGVTWNFTIQPNASVQPSVISGVSVTGATVDLSTVLSAGIKAPRFPAGPNAYGYTDGEISASSVGNTYFNTGSVCSATGGMRQLSNVGWQCEGGVGSTATVVVAASNSPQKASANVKCSGTDDQICINNAIAANCPPSDGSPANVVQCKVLLLPGVYKLSGSIVVGTDDWNLVGIGHAMWGGFITPWQGSRSVTGGSCNTNLCTFTVGFLYPSNLPIVLAGFAGTGSTSINNFTCFPGGPPTSTSFTCTIPGTGTIASTGAGILYPATGAIGTGGAQLLATAGGFPLISITHPATCGTGPDVNRCRGWKVENIYGVCYGYSGNFLDSGNTGDDNIMISDNVIQRCNHGVTGFFDSPTLSSNSFQDNLGDFFHATADYVKGDNNLIFDNGGYAYNFLVAGKGGSIVDRAWGDLTGGITGTTNNLSVGGFTVFNVGTTLATSPPVVNLTGSNNIVHDLSMNLQGRLGGCVVFSGAAGGAITGNVCNRSGSSSGPNDAIAVSGSGVVASGNSIISSTGVVQAQAINFSACTNCAVGTNATPGVWNFGGPPITVGTGSVANGNVAVTAVSQGIAPINSAYLLERFQATNAAPATNGSTLTGWSDSGGLGYNVNSIYGSPTYTTSSPINSLPAVNFNGTDAGVYASTIVAAAASQERIYWVVFNQTTSASSGTQNLLSEGGFARNIYITGATNTLNVYGGSGGAFSSTINAALGVTHVLEVVLNGTSSRIVLDGSQAATFSLSNSITSNGLSFGSKGVTPGQFFAGYIAEVAGYNGGNSGTYSVSDAQSLGAAYCSAFGVTCGTSW